MAKLKDGFYKLTASSIGSDLHVLLAGGGAKPISDFASSFNVKLWGLDFDGSRDVNGVLTTNSYITFNKTGSELGYIGLASSKNDDIYFSSSGNLYINGNENTFINHNGGNVGIGTTTPQHKLSVFGQAYVSDSGPSIIINRTGTYKQEPCITYYADEVQLGSIGIKDYNTPFFWNASTKNINTIWHSGNDGSESGLDADLLDGYHVSNFMQYASVSTYVTANLINSELLSLAGGNGYIEYYDSGTWFNSKWGKVTAHYGFEGLLTGNASSATKLQTPRTIWGQSFNGTANVDGILKMNVDLKSNSAGNYALQINNTGTFAGPRLINAFSPNISISSSASDGVHLMFGVANSSYNSAYMKFWYAGAGSTNNAIRFGFYGSDNLVSLLGNGNVGIGTTSPSEKLHIVGQALLSLSANGNLYYIAQGLTNGIRFGLGSGGINRGIYDNTNSNWMLYRDSTTNVLIPIGNVGIGTTTPIHKLQVVGAGVFNNTSSTTYASDGITIGAGDVKERYITCYGKTGSSYINVGYGPGANNCAEFAFIYLGNNSNSNSASISLYGASNVVYVYPEYTQSKKNISAPNYISTAATGALPYACTSTTLNTNLNADLLDGYHANQFTRAGTLSYSDSLIAAASRNRSYLGSWLNTNTSIWYNVISVRHRNNESDGNLYGMLLYSVLTTNGNLCWNKVCNGTALGERIILDSVNYSGLIDSRYINVSGDTMLGKLYFQAHTDDSFYIGTTVSGTTSYLDFYVSDDAEDGFRWITNLWASAGNVQYTMMQLIGNVSKVATLSLTGNMTATGNINAAHFYENSDKNLKTNIKNINSYNNIPLLQEFDWKESGEHSYGLIAQELEEQGYSELVSTKDDGYKTVNYSAALSLIVGKLQVKIKELEKEIENLKNKN